MEQQTVEETKPTNKNRTIIIIAVVAVVLCCCLLVAAVAGYYAFTTIRSMDSSSLQPSDQIVVPQTDFGNDNPPSGGLGNDVLKNDTWRVGL